MKQACKLFLALGLVAGIVIAVYFHRCSKFFGVAVEALHRGDLRRFEVALREMWNPNFRSLYFKNTLSHYLVTGEALKDPEKCADAIAVFVRNGGDINARDFSGRTALHVAYVKHAHQDVLSALIKHGADQTALDAAGRVPDDYDADSPQ